MELTERELRDELDRTDFKLPEKLERALRGTTDRDVEPAMVERWVRRGRFLLGEQKERREAGLPPVVRTRQIVRRQRG